MGTQKGKNTMKRLTLYLLTCLLCLSACGHSGEEPEGWTARQMARAILDTQKEVSAVTELTDGAEDFAVYLTGCYQMDPAQVEEGAILSAASPPWRWRCCAWWRMRTPTRSSVPWRPT